MYIYIILQGFFFWQILSWIQTKLNGGRESKKSSLISATGELFFDVFIVYILFSIHWLIYHQLKYDLTVFPINK